jgi:hypothetical protein
VRDGESVSRQCLEPRRKPSHPPSPELPEQLFPKWYVEALSDASTTPAVFFSLTTSGAR